MTDKTLLPTGCYDLLPPFARQEFALSAALLDGFESYGYEQVAPPLLEYTETMLAGRGSKLADLTCRVIDTTANKVMGIRPDITLQIARIAASKLADSPKPLRLSYNGLIVRMQSDGLQEERQLRQAGIELIGAASPEADAEVILVSALTLQKAGVTALSIDLNLPGIVSALLAAERLEAAQLEALHEAVAQKDVSAIRNINIRYRDTLIELIQCAGPAERALSVISRLDLPDSARTQFEDLRDVVHILNRCATDTWSLTIDATENRGLSYHSGIHFSIFIPGASYEVGRGGRYHIEHGGQKIEATGFTLYVESLRRLLPKPDAAKRIFVPFSIEIADVEALQAQGYVTIHSLPGSGQGKDEAARLNCQYLYNAGKVEPI